jgi:hypothetical protein
MQGPRASTKGCATPSGPCPRHHSGEDLPRLREAQNLGIDHITQWDDPADSISWKFIASHSGRYLVKLTAATESDGQMVKLGGVGDFACKVPKVERMKRDFKTLELGEAELGGGETSTIRLQAVPEGWNSVNVFSVELVPVKREAQGKSRGADAP